MKTLTSAHVGQLRTALLDAFPSVNKLDELLRSDRLDKRFDELTSRSISLGDNAWEIASKAGDQGWAILLLVSARELQPDNPKLRALWDALPERDEAAPDPSSRRADRPSLLCGRGLQWNEICQIAPAHRHHVIVVHGGFGQDPLHFRARVKTWLSTEPRRSIVEVDWPRLPNSRGEFFEALGRAIAPDVSMLSKTIADRLAVENLVILHACLTANFESPALIQYYTEWLPELLSCCPKVSNLKCVQPIEWPLEAGARSTWKQLWSGGEAKKKGRTGALALMTALQSKQAATLPIVGLDELVNLTDEEIQTFLENSGLTADQQKRMRAEIQAVPQIPLQIFATIDSYWEQVQAGT